MTTPLSILAGPARSGKTERLLAAYRSALRSGPPRTTLWLAPTHRGVADILARLPGPDLPACFSPGVLTFANFAGEVLAASGRPIHAMSTLMKRQLVRFLIEERRRAGELRHFAPIADTHGLIDLVTGFISELKRLEIWPDDFRQACVARGLRDKDRELLALYEAYQQRLREHQLYDAEGQFWSARDLMSSGQTEPWRRLRLVVVDGFTDFTRTQHEMLALLAGRAEAMLVSLPLESAPRRDDLFAKTRKTLDLLKERAPHGVRVEELPRRNDSDWPALEHLEAELFQNPRRARPAPAMRRIEIVGAFREQGEIEQIGRRIKRLLTEGCVDAEDSESRGMAGNRARPGEIAVVFRSLTDVAPRVREVFGELGIPFDLETTETLDETPLAVAVVAVLRLAVQDWPYRQLLAVLGNSYVQPAWPEHREGEAARAAQRAVRGLQIPSGAKPLLEALRRRHEHLARPARNGRDDETHSAREQRRQLADLQLALPLLSRWQQALGQLPTSAGQTEWTDALERLADNLGMLRVIGTGDAEIRQRDQDAWRCLVAALHEGGVLFQNMNEQPPRLTAAEFLDLLIDLLRWQRLPRHHDDIGRVRVLSAASVRALRVPYFFFAGLSERAFPSPDRHDRLYSEGEYRQLREERPDLPLPLRHERHQEEMLLFYESITRATRRLWLSYPALDAKAEPLLPSPYVREVERAAGGGIAHRVSPDLSAVPRTESGPQSVRDFRLQAVDQALSGDASLLAALPALGEGVRQRVLNGLTMIRQRATREYGGFDGLLLGDAARGEVANRFGPKVPWSVSQIEEYALCPHKFFLHRLLKLDELDDLSLEPDYMQRGSLVHEVLAELHRRLNDEQGEPSSPGAINPRQFEEEAEAIIRRAIERQGARQGGGHDVQSALAEIDRRTLLQWLEGYRQQHEEYDQKLRKDGQLLLPAHFEVSFGLPTQHGDPLSTEQPWEATHQGETLRFSGRIDRIDINRIDVGQREEQHDGRRLFCIIDYKSGKVLPRVSDEPPDGRQVQLELYALAAQELLFGKQAAPVNIGYWYVKQGGFRSWPPLHEKGEHGGGASEYWRQRVPQVLDQVFALVRGIRAAEFPMASRDEHCTGYCPFKTVCRVNHARALGKSWQPPQREPAPAAGG